MQNYDIIEKKLERFIKKFYSNLLIKGALLFVGISLLLFIFMSALEYFLWFSSGLRTFLFWTVLAVELVLLFKLILIPASQLFKISKGIEYAEASDYIGTHFPEVSDKLKNILQLKAQGAQGELLLASIEQKSKDLKTVPFQVAIDFTQNLKYLRLLAIPVLIILAIWISGLGDSFSSSYKRLVNYDTAYEPPAPFQFTILNPSLQVAKGKSFQLNVKTLGDIKPEEVLIEVGGEAYRLTEEGDVFRYTFNTVDDLKRFQLKANKVVSKVYELSAMDIPILKDMEMRLNFPAYTNQSFKTISGTGNASVPEGTEIEWIISTETTDQVEFNSKEKQIKFESSESGFSLTQIQKTSVDYSISTSNSNFKNYDVLNYSIEVIQDEFPKLVLQEKKDSLLVEQSYFFGKVTDDYRLTKLQLVYYSADNEDITTKKDIEISKSNYAEFSYAFPNEDLELMPGTNYSYYFEVYDNDEVNGRKSSKSKVFSYRQKTKLEESTENLKRQNTSVEKLSEELKQQKESNATLRELQNKQKKEKSLDYTEKQKLDSFIKRQKQQMELMKNYSERLKEDFKKLNPEEQDKAKENLEERLESNQKQIEKNQELLKELDELRDKIDREELNQKLENFDKESKKQEKNLEQLLELTKRFYVEKKTEKLAEELKNLAKEQEDLSKAEENTSEEQEKLNEKFDKLKEALEELEDKNEDLKAPMDIGSDKGLEEEIDQDQEEAKEELENSEENSENSEEGWSKKEKAQEKQKKASEKMKSLSEKMQQSMMSSSMEQAAEDADMLRQILNNLILFSQEQEGLMESFKGMSNSNPAYASKLKRQAELRENFKHADDSLYALAMRTPMITEEVNNKISDINFNIEKSLERLAENEVRMGTSSQQYTMMFANELSSLLDDALDQMQNQMKGSGSGKPKPSGSQSGEQLSDIIKSHEELQKQMEKGKSKGQGESSKSEKGGEKEGEEGKDGEKGKNEGDSEGGEKEGGEQQGSQQGNEQMSGEVYQIYKQQQDLRNQLENEINRLGLEGNTNELTKSLDRLEQELLMKGFSNDLLQQMDAVKHQLLKLEKAANQQGQDEDRQAKTNQKEFNSNSEPWEEKAKEYFNTTEILNRQQLPLQPEYKKLINIYFDGRSN
ncbi:hypothetical protein ES731_12890 [Psychroflexus gondwanensis]|uniref:hypothetical protein n=1 Tax=Psychroflexus gondwanensis TaxID=251 RepID=UPI0011BD7047|nr:hypothetical protein [Psychroflexus gondwanensis]TXE17017.1 hypothetical protein ES731_12890 [Psychroflexus gondwanensis]